MSTFQNCSTVQWVKSTYSGNGGGSCVEWAPTVARTGVVPVRDSKDTARPALAFPVDSFATFVAAVRRRDL